MQGATSLWRRKKSDVQTASPAGAPAGAIARYSARIRASSFGLTKPSLGGSRKPRQKPDQPVAHPAKLGRAASPNDVGDHHSEDFTCLLREIVDSRQQITATRESPIIAADAPLVSLQQCGPIGQLADTIRVNHLDVSHWPSISRRCA